MILYSLVIDFRIEKSSFGKEKSLLFEGRLFGLDGRLFFE